MPEAGDQVVWGVAAVVVVVVAGVADVLVATAMEAEEFLGRTLVHGRISVVLNGYQDVRAGGSVLAAAVELPTRGSGNGSRGKVEMAVTLLATWTRPNKDSFTM